MDNGQKMTREWAGSEGAGLKELLYEEAGIDMSDELFERFVGSMDEFTLRNKQVLIPAGKVDTNLYVQKNGVLRASYFDGENEKTYGFSTPGSVVMSYHSHRMGKPSFFEIRSHGETDMLRMSKRTMDELIDSSREFAKWLLAVQSMQLYLNEFKHAGIPGSPKERYLWTLRNRPEVLARVPSKILASYLGVSPVHFSRLKKSLH